jgi:hypothetical protein
LADPRWLGQDAAHATPLTPAASRPARLRRSAEEAHHRRGHQRVPPRQRPARAPVPRRLEADGHCQRHLPRRLAPRGLRRDRHGPSARAHDVQGDEEAPQGPGPARKAWRQHERQHRARSHQLLRGRPGRPGHAGQGAGSRSRPHGPRQDLRRRSQVGVLGGAQRARDGGELAPGRAGTTTARAPSARRATSRGSPPRRCASSIKSTIGRTTPCWW